MLAGMFAFLEVITPHKKFFVILFLPSVCQFMVFYSCCYSASCLNIQLSLTSIFCEPRKRSTPLSQFFQLQNNNENIQQVIIIQITSLVVFFLCAMKGYNSKKVHSNRVKYLNEVQEEEHNSTQWKPCVKWHLHFHLTLLRTLMKLTDTVIQKWPMPWEFWHMPVLQWSAGWSASLPRWSTFFMLMLQQPTTILTQSAQLVTLPLQAVVEATSYFRMVCLRVNLFSNYLSVKQQLVQGKKRQLHLQKQHLTKPCVIF